MYQGHVGDLEGEVGTRTPLSTKLHVKPRPRMHKKDRNPIRVLLLEEPDAHKVINEIVLETHLMFNKTQ